MLRASISMVIAAVAIAATIPASAAEPGTASPPASSRFDPGTVSSFSGRVEAVRKVKKRHNVGVHLDLATADGTMDVHLGPATYVDRAKVKIAKGDEVEVTGSKVTIEGKPAIIAQTVKKGQESLQLRDTSGKPLWSRRGRR